MGEPELLVAEFESGNVVNCYSHVMKIRTISQRELGNQTAAVLREVAAGRTIDAAQFRADLNAAVHRPPDR